MSDNQIVNTERWAEEARLAGMEWAEIPAHVNARIKAGYPIVLGVVTAVQYDTKNDRYTLKFDHGTAKATTDVAAFLLTNAFDRAARPLTYARMTDGTIDAVLLRYLA